MYCTLSNCVTYSMLCCDALAHAHMCMISPYKIINFRSKIQDETVCFFNFFSKGIFGFFERLVRGCESPYVGRLRWRGGGVVSYDDREVQPLSLIHSNNPTLPLPQKGGVLSVDTPPFTICNVLLLKHSLYLLGNGLTIVAKLLIKHLERSRVTEVVEAVNEALVTNQTCEVDRETRGHTIAW